MSVIGIRALAQLLARARAAIETPADLDDAARAAVIEDIAAFEDCLAQDAIPWASTFTSARSIISMAPTIMPR